MKRVFGLAAALILSVCAFAVPIDPVAVVRGNTALPDSLRFALITCDPGPEIFELYGHQGIRVSGRVQGNPIDFVYNYGMFDFNSPGFVTRFVAGRTDYYAAALPTQYFLLSYSERGSRVTEFPLLLSEEEARTLFDLLNADVQPGNSTYRYKYFTNNCSTRILDRLDQALGAPAHYPVTADTEDAPALPADATYRQQLQLYNSGYPWYQLGIDLALGSSIDKPVSSRGRMFAPIALETALPQATRADGRPLVGAPVTLVEGRGDRKLPATPWWLAPGFVFSLFSLIVCGFAVYGWLRRRRMRGLYCLWELLAGLTGCLVWYLAFVSEHEGTSPNLLAWWLNPLWLVPAFSSLTRNNNFTNAFLALEALVAAVLLCACPWLPQAFNPALLPLMAVSVILPLARLFPRR